MENIISYFKKIIFVSLFLVPATAFAYSVSLTADTGGSVSFGGLTGGFISGTQAGTSRTFIRAIPSSGKTFYSWTGDLSGYPSTINQVIPSNITAVATFSNSPTAIMSIGNKCIERVLNFTITTARPDGGNQVTRSRAQVYVFEDSSFDFNVQDTSGYLLSSPNQAFYYSYNANTVGAGTYLGSNAAFVGNTRYLSLGSATLVTDVRYDCSATSVVRYGVTFTSNLPPSVSATLSGAGTYNAHARVTLTASTPENYRLTAFTGTVGNTAILYSVTGSNLTNSYTIEDLTGYSDIQAYYVYVPPDANSRFTLTLTADPNGSVCINGSCGGVISQTVIAGTSLNVSVVPDSGYQFYAWSSDFSGRSSSFSILMDRDYQALAGFSSVSTLPGDVGTGAIAKSLRASSSPVLGAGFVTCGLYSYSFPFDFRDCIPYSHDNVSVTIPTPTANDGWRFLGWSGNVASTTLLKINSGASFNLGELNSITDPYIIANFDFDGSEQTAGGVQYSEVVASSPTAILTEDVFNSVVNYDGSYNVSPYTINGVCVTNVTTIKAQRASNSLTGLFAGTYTYSLYALAGSDLNASKSGRFYVFKSDPSNFYLRASDTPLPAGDYTSDQLGEGFNASPIFSASDNTFTFRSSSADGDLVLISNDSYSCTAGYSDSPSYAPTYVGSSPNDSYSISGYSYLPTFDLTNLVNVETYDSITATSSTRHVVPGYDNTDKVKHAYRRIDCEQPLSGISRLGVYCASTFKFSQFYEHDYAWLFTTKPVKYFYHQQMSNPAEVLDGADPVYGLMVFPADKTVLVMGSSTSDVSLLSDNDLSSNISTSAFSRDDLSRYATRINLTNCRWYPDAGEFYGSESSYLPCTNIPFYDIDDSGVLTITPYRNFSYTGTLSEAGKLNGIMLDVDQDFDGEYLFYGLYFTSSGQFNVKANSDLFKLFSSLRVASNSERFLLADLTPTVTTTSEVVTDFNNYIATSTIPGYHETINAYWETVYHATSTYTATSTGGTITKVGSDYVHLFTASSTFTPSANIPNAQVLVIGGGGSGSYVQFSPAGAGGASGVVRASSTMYISSGVKTVTVGAPGAGRSSSPDIAGLPGATSTFNGLTAPGGSGGRVDSVGGSNADYSGGNASSYAGGGAGAGGNGHNGIGSSDGLGGTGYTSSITGSSVQYAQGGGGFYTYSSAGTYGSGGMGANGGSDSGTVGAVIIRYNPSITVDGYYEDVFHATSTVYHATSTVPGYHATTTRDVYTISTSTLSRNGVRLFTFGSDTYSSSFNSTLGYRSLAQFSTDMYSRYSLSKCDSSGLLGYFGDFLCLIRNSLVNVVIFFVVPPPVVLQEFNNVVNSIVENTGSPLSLVFSIPLRFYNYADLDWVPATSTKLTLGMSTSTQVVFTAPSASSTLIYSKSDYMISEWLGIFISLVISVFVSLWAINLILS